MSQKYILFMEVVKVGLSLLWCLRFPQYASQVAKETVSSSQGLLLVPPTQCTMPGIPEILQGV